MVTVGRQAHTRMANAFVKHGQPLTPREEQILALITHDLTNPQIANRLYCSASTIENQISNMLVKTGARSKVGLAVWACTHARFDQPPGP